MLRQPGHLLPVQPDLAAARQVDQAELPQQGGLAGAALAHDARHRPGGDLQRDVVKRPDRHLSHLVGLRQVFGERPRRRLARAHHARRIPGPGRWLHPRAGGGPAKRRMSQATIKPPGNHDDHHDDDEAEQPDQVVVMARRHPSEKKNLA